MRSRVAILGAGALGCLYARELHHTGSAECFFIAEGVRAEKLRKKGITVNGEHLSLPVFQSGGQQGGQSGGQPVSQQLSHQGAQSGPDGADLLIVALKHHHLGDALPLAKPFINKETIIISVMNGISSEKTIQTLLGHQRIVHCVALGMDSVRSNGEVRYSTAGKLLLGKPGVSGAAKEEDPDLLLIKDILSSAAFPLVFSDDIIRDQWWKFMINVGINQASAVTGATYRFFQDRNSQARRLMDDAMQEVLSLASNMGIDLGQKDIEKWYTILDTLGPEGKTSMLQDMEAGRKSEVEMFAGTLIDLGLICGLTFPVNRTILRIIEAREEALFDSTGSI